MCLDLGSVCDLYPQCPLHDDEILCSSLCNYGNCRCQGYEVTCRFPLVNETYRDARYIDVSGTSPGNLLHQHHPYLIHLNASRSGIKNLPYLYIPNLRELDISYNFIQSLDLNILEQSKRLTLLIISYNPLREIFMKTISKGLNEGLISTVRFASLTALDISGTLIDKTTLEDFISILPKLSLLNISSLQNSVLPKFAENDRLEKIDLRGTKTDRLDKDMFANLFRLESIFTSDFKLCCHQVLPRHVSNSFAFTEIYLFE